MRGFTLLLGLSAYLSSCNADGRSHQGKPLDHWLRECSKAPPSQLARQAIETLAAESLSGLPEALSSGDELVRQALKREVRRENAGKTLAEPESVFRTRHAAPRY